MLKLIGPLGLCCLELILELFNSGFHVSDVSDVGHFYLILELSCSISFRVGFILGRVLLDQGCLLQVIGDYFGCFLSNVGLIESHRSGCGLCNFDFPLRFDEVSLKNFPGYVTGVFAVPSM